MPITVNPHVALWLQKMQVLPQDIKISKQTPFEFPFNQQIYLENGYHIGRLLRNVLKMNGNTAEGLLRIRKIAYLTSNENWHILKDILQELTFELQIDPENITTTLIEDILEFLHDLFASKPSQKKQKVTTIDLHSFQAHRPIEASHNLLQFLVLALQQVLHIDTPECMGLLINQGRFFKQMVVGGTNHEQYEPIAALYRHVIAHAEHLNRLLGEQYGGQEHFMRLLGFGVLSQSSEVCHHCCQMLNEIDSDWPQQTGINIIIRSPHHQALDLLFRRLGPNVGSVLNQSLHKRLDDNFIVEMKVYNRLIKYFHQSLFGKEALKALQMSYYITRAFDLFEPDRNMHSSVKQRSSARTLLAAITRYFDKKLTSMDQGKVLYCFDPALTHTREERFTTIAILFELLHEIMEKQREFGFKLFGVIWKFYSIDHCKDFVMDNLTHMFRVNPSNFPIAQFLHLYQPSPIFQQHQFELLLELSRMKDLSHPLGQTLLQTATIYYYQQLHASCSIQIILNVIKNSPQIKWALQVSVQILGKWPSLHIPPYQPLPPQSKKIKFRSVGLKKRQMMQFTQINRYKNLLLALTQLRDKNFLVNYAKNIVLTIKAVQKSKVKQMKNTQGWLNQLLALVDRKRSEVREQVKATPIATFDQGQSATSYLKQDSLSESQDDISEQVDPFKIEDSEVENEFIRDTEVPLDIRPLELSPLLPFSEEEIEYYPLVCQQLFFENYENIFIRNLNQKYSPLLHFLTTKYKTSLDLEHFFKNIGIFTYIKDHMNSLQELDKKLELAEDSPSKRVQKLIVQASLFAFEFKKSRRVTIKCLESFFTLLQSKNPSIEQYQNSKNQPAFISKVQFESFITPLIKKANQAKIPYFQCFQIVSQIFEKALGIPEIEPVSKIVSEFKKILPSPEPVSHIEEQPPIKEDSQTKQMHQLQKIIQSQSIKVSPSNFRSTPAKKKHRVEVYPPLTSSSKQTPERWLQLQRKVAKHRQQLQARNKKISI